MKDDRGTDAAVPEGKRGEELATSARIILTTLHVRSKIRSGQGKRTSTTSKREKTGPESKPAIRWRRVGGESISENWHGIRAIVRDS